MNRLENPPWWGSEYDFAWDHVKLDVERDLKAGRADGFKIKPFLGHSFFREFEPACRFGFGARLEFDREQLVGNEKFEQCLRSDWRAMYPMRAHKWEKDRIAILYGWNYASEELKKSDDRKIKTVLEPAENDFEKNMTVKNIITPAPHCIGPDASLVEAAIEMKIFDTGWLPVYENGRLIGTLTDRDITIRSVAEGYDLNVITVRRVMSRGVICCFDDQNIEEAAKIMEMHQIRRLPVLDRNQHLVGIISLGDLAVRAGGENLAARTLERISEPARQAA